MEKQKNEEKDERIYLYTLGAIVLILFMFSIIIVFSQFSNIASENNKIENANEYARQYNELDSIFQKGEKLYQESTEHYSDNEFEQLINKCEKARDYYAEYSQELYNHRARLQYQNLPAKFKSLYYDLITEDIKISNNMFETCEYFESAALYYSKNDIRRGDSSIESMNEKINAHDDATRRYNDILGKIIAYQESL